MVTRLYMYIVGQKTRESKNSGKGMRKKRKGDTCTKERTIRKFVKGNTMALTKEAAPWTDRRGGEKPRLNATSLVYCPLKPGHETPPRARRPKEWNQP